MQSAPRPDATTGSRVTHLRARVPLWTVVLTVGFGGAIALAHIPV
jgi:hypothetical protein